MLVWNKNKAKKQNAVSARDISYKQQKETLADLRKKGGGEERGGEMDEKGVVREY